MTIGTRTKSAACGSWQRNNRENQSWASRVAGSEENKILKQYGLSEYETDILVGDKTLADYFEDLTSQDILQKKLQLILGELPSVEGSGQG